METHLVPELRASPAGREAEAILRACVHCGFCTATCPTYQLLGDELDGPRGRIYLIKRVLEGAAPGRVTQTHLDRCLLCRACETTCPSGVRYARLVEIGRSHVDPRVHRPWPQRLLRGLLGGILPRPRRVHWLLMPARLLRPLLPGRWRRLLPEPFARPQFPAGRHTRRVIFLDGCVQPVLAPEIDAAATRVLDRLGIGRCHAPSGCCGALSAHLGDERRARAFMRRNIDRWWPRLEDGAEAVTATASGCLAMLKEYGERLADDPAYAHKARVVSDACRDLTELIPVEELAPYGARRRMKAAVHTPCTLQHALGQVGRLEPRLAACGYEVLDSSEGHLCCGSAGTYSILQPRLARRLRERKLERLESGSPDVIATANIGCLTHLRAGTETPVRHWIELVDEAMATP